MINSSQRPIAVFGGTGFLGREIVSGLVRRNLPVRVLSRNRERAKSILDPRVSLIEGDVMAKVDLEKMLEGVDRVVIALSAFTPRLVRDLERIERHAVIDILDLAERKGIRRVVYLSVYDIDRQAIRGLDIPSSTIKSEVESALREGQLNWTVLGIAPSMQIFFAMIRRHTLVIPGGGKLLVPTIHRRDVGEIGAQVILRDDLDGCRFRMTGPEAFSFPDAATRIAAATGLPIKYRPIPLLPLKLLAALSRPFNPYLAYLRASLQLLNRFPAEIAEQVPKDHARLRETFSYQPVSLDQAALEWKGNR